MSGLYRLVPAWQVVAWFVVVGAVMFCLGWLQGRYGGRGR